RLDLPEPERPVMTISASRGRSTSTPLRLCSRAPRTLMWVSIGNRHAGEGNGATWRAGVPETFAAVKRRSRPDCWRGCGGGGADCNARARASAAWRASIGSAPMSHRLFIAIRPPAPVREALLDTMEGIEGARWQDEEKLHLTLRFAGEVERPAANDLAAALGRIAAAPFALRIAGVGHFERKGQPHTLWAGAP